MICAIYARKSTDQNSVADDQKSVTRQIDHARAYARRKGWTPADAHVYVDDGISGAEFAARHGYTRLLNALKPRAPFGGLIISELSRLGREQLETGYAMKQLAQAGVRIFSYLEDREILLDTPTDKFLMSAVNFASEIEREKSRQRVYDAMTRKARNGHVCGGRTFGYDNVEVNGPDGRRSHVERSINNPEADVVRRIFALCASGRGVKSIAKTLNTERAPSPRPQQGRPSSWAPSSVREVLYRDAYRGRLVWNKTRKRNNWGQIAATARPESDWLTQDAPHMRIVGDEAWEAAHRRLKSARASYMRSSNGAWGRPPSGTESKYLLSGLMRCACCGQSMTVRSRDHGRHRFHYYICAGYDHRGRTVCVNNLPLPMAGADDAVLTELSDYVLDRDVVEGAIADAITELRPSRANADAKREVLTARIRALDKELERYVAAIGVAGQVEALAHTLRERAEEQQQLRLELAAIDGLSGLTQFDVKHIERDLRGRLAEWRQLLRRQTPQARQMVQLLLDDKSKIEWTPHKDEGLYAFAGKARLDRLLSGLVVTQGMASPPGFEPGFQP